MNKIEVNNKKVNKEKLLEFGFLKQGNCYTYTADLLNNQMKLIVKVCGDGVLFTQIVDNISNEEYVLHLVPDAVGAFVGQIRNEHEKAVCEILNSCFDSNVFKSGQTQRIIEYIRSRYEDELEFLWAKSPDNAIWRRKDNKKWYAALLTVSKRKLGIDSDEITEIIDLKMKSEDIETLVDNKKYYRGYHMNKKHWITVCLDGEVSDEEIQKRIDDSYELSK